MARHLHRPRHQRAKRLENELAQYRNTLEKEVEQKTAQLARLNQSLREANRQLADTKCQLQETQRMKSLEHLAGGVAHEIDNPIAFISTNFGALKRYFDELFALLQRRQASGTPIRGTDQEEPDLDEMKADVEALVAESMDGLSRVNKVVQNLRGFASAGLGSWQSFDLNGGLESTLSLLQWRSTHADLIRDYGRITDVQCLPSAINLVFMNLLLNAAEAITGHGTITVRTRAADGGVCVEVIDTGCGITEDNLPRVFDPFFTTKPIGQGLGLRLSLSYGIIQRHHGRIEVASTVGKGSRFRVWLPCRQEGDSGEGA
jgi:signal transduction histidine kinase